MGNLCCKVTAAEMELKYSLKPKSPKLLSAISERSNENAGSSDGDLWLEDRETLRNRRLQSEETIFYDALDHFPSEGRMSYPPTHSMRRFPSELNMEMSDSLRLLMSTSKKDISLKSESSLKNETFLSSSEIDTTAPSQKTGDRTASVVLVSEHLKAETPGTQGRGYPGELTPEEFETCLEFRAELKKRDSAFYEMVKAMHPYEHEAFALCRFLRARDFNKDDVFTMLEEKNQVTNWHNCQKTTPNYYKEFHKIPAFNGCPLPVFITQLPMIHTGIGKNGAIVVYVQAGKINCPGIECIVGDIENALPFVWNRLYHGCRDAMAREKACSDPATTTVLAEKIMVADLKGDGGLFSAGMPFLRASPTAAACFPENVNRTYVLNAPFSFSVIWAVLKQLLEPRTVQKIGFFSTVAKAKKDFLDHIDSEKLLSDYGGTGPSFDDVLKERQKQYAHKEGISRYIVELLSMNGREQDFSFEIAHEDEQVDSIVVYSRSDNGCEMSVEAGKNNLTFMDYKPVNRSVATTIASKDAPTNGNNNGKDIDKAFNNYAVEIATSDDFANENASSDGAFRIQTKNSTKGDYFLIAISIASKTKWKKYQTTIFTSLPLS